MPIAHDIVSLQQSRRQDRWGTGQFGASRDDGRRAHAGLDIVTRFGEPIYSPVHGDVVRETFPYKDDHSLVGVLLRGVAEWEGYEVKVFYVSGLLCGRVIPGQLIGHAQDLQKKYPKIINHIHVEVRRAGRVLDPHELWQRSF